MPRRRPDEAIASAPGAGNWRLRWAMRAVATRAVKPHEIYAPRHLAGLSLCGLSPVPVSLPQRLVRGAARQIDPWWRADAVRRPITDEELAEERRVPGTSRYLIRTEERQITLLDGRRLTVGREVYHDAATGRGSKELYARDEAGARFAFNSIPKHLMALDGLDAVEIGPGRDVVVTEGYPAAEALRHRGVDAVAIMSGTFDLPSDRTLAPLLDAGHVVLWPDNDSAGAHLMSRVAAALDRMGARPGQVKVVLWRDGPRKGDAYDFSGGPVELHALLGEAFTWDRDVLFATGSIHALTVPSVAPRLRLGEGLRPPTPKLGATRPQEGPSAAPPSRGTGEGAPR